MNEAEFVFNSQVRERKDLKNQARKMNRTGKGPVRFPSDYLSKKEREAMNGECTVWNLNGFYGLEDFKRMPDDIKISWINKILNVYNARLSDISMLCFDKSKSYLSWWLKKHPEVESYINIPKRGSKISQTDYDKLVQAIENWRNPKIEVVEPDPEPEMDDFTKEEKDFISAYLAPISEEKEEKTMDDEELIFHEDESVEFEVDDADLRLPNMTTLKFTMEGFDMEFIEIIRKKFGSQKVTVTLSVVADNE